MSRVILILILAAMSGLLLVKAPADYQTSSLVLTHVTVIDATGKPAQPEMTVVITGDRITEIGPTRKVQIPKNAKVLDASGKFLIPGLWDMHVHLFDKDYFKLFVANGVTGIRIMWGFRNVLDWRKEIKDGTLLGPRMVTAGSIVDGPKPIWPGSTAVANEAEGRQAVIKTKQDGYDFVKVYNLIPRDAYFAIADEAKKQGIPFAGHVPDSVTVAEASDAGQKSIEHLTGILGACSTSEAEVRKQRQEIFSKLPAGQSFPSPASVRVLTRTILDTFNSEKANSLFARLKQNHTWQCPTVTVLKNFAFANDPKLRDDPRLKYLPRQTRTSWDPTQDFRFKNKTSEDFELGRLVYQKQLVLVDLLNRSGVELLAGTDTPNPYCFPGFSLHDELDLLVSAGLSPMSALQTATLNPARFFGQEKELGTVESGKLADLLLLDGNPLDDIKNTRKIDAVVLGGKLILKPQLEQLLAEVEANAAKN